MLCGIDEAGRGPLAGALVVAGVILKEPIEGLNDSKKLSAKKREMLFDKIVANPHHIVVTSNIEIDTLGLSACIKKSLEEIKQNLKANEYIFDGPCSFGASNITTLVKADSLVSEVMAASILAKVTRDKMMLEIDIDGFSFTKHKGYGTKAHIEEIKTMGLSPIHRKSYCKKFI